MAAVERCPGCEGRRERHCVGALPTPLYPPSGGAEDDRRRARSAAEGRGGEQQASAGLLREDQASRRAEAVRRHSGCGLVGPAAAAGACINDLRDRLDRACGGRVVSCADILTLAARDSVALASGPAYEVPLGRREGLAPASQDAVFAALPPPSSNVTTLLSFLSRIDLDATDLVALSGGHTVGVAHCGSFEDHLFPTQDPTLNQWFAGRLRLTCPAKGADGTTANDIRTPNTFDKYYVDLLDREGLFTSDQDLFTDGRTKPLVTKFSVDQDTLAFFSSDAFFQQFVYSYVKMGQINVLTGATQGQIRANCSARNNNEQQLPPWSVVETVVDAAESIVL
ncbi:cationic peroxidase SPC4-like [Panicum virgatum]|uniref:cationic peroxidase SPC4-like n=1 Tax=Panicum virgatum TaxID=38727 RepID=UPI0019D56A03|nr:cationic peroxidase SPC4-like [Panicum virgatum]